MKVKHYILFFMTWITFTMSAQNTVTSNSYSNQKTETEIIEDINIDLNSNTYYKQQSDNWSGNLMDNAEDAQSWYNYYKASRFEYSTLQYIIIPQVYQNELDRIVQAMAENVPRSYEYNYIKYWNGNYDTRLFSYLQKAYEIDPYNTELYDDFIAYYEITGNETGKKEFCKKWHNTKEFPEDLFEYNYNVLMSVGKNAILITNGHNDTYPLWILQEVLAVRTDVTLLNIKILGNEQYRNKMLDELGLKVTSLSDYTLYPEEFFRSLCINNPEKNIYFSLTIPSKIYQNLLNQLYPTGLALKFSDRDFDNIREMEKAWSKDFKKDYLYDPTTKFNVNILNKNYIILLTLLEEYYTEANKQDQVNDIRKIKETILNKSTK